MASQSTLNFTKRSLNPLWTELQNTFKIKMWFSITRFLHDFNSGHLRICHFQCLKRHLVAWLIIKHFTENFQIDFISAKKSTLINERLTDLSEIPFSPFLSVFVFASKAIYDFGAFLSLITFWLKNFKLIRTCLGR